MQWALLFIAVSACAGGGSAAPPPPIAWPQQRVLGDATIAPPLPAAPVSRGGACGPTSTCAAGLTCFAAPGGVCASRCGVFGSPCDGACVTTVREGELCLAKCEADADCRSGEGYFCDPQWKACAIPNTLAMEPRTCPGLAARDLAFGAPAQLDAPGVYQQDPAAILASDGSVFVIASAPTDELTQLVDARVLAPSAPAARALLAPPNAPSSQGSAGAPAAANPRDRARVFVETAPERGPSVSLARDRKGVLYAVWLDARRGPSVLLARSRDDGRTWSAPVTASEPADCGGLAPCLEQAFVVVGPDPAAKQRDVLYIGYVTAGAVRVRASYDEGASLRAPVTALSAIRASATVDATGRLHLIGVRGGPTTGAYGSASHAIVYATSANAGRTFTRPATISRRDERLPFSGAVPQLVVDTRRKWLYAVYVRGGRDAVWDLAMLASKDNGATWKRTRIGDDCATHMVPRAALDPTTGALHLAWYDSRSTGRFAHASCTPGLAKCTPGLAINDRAFTALSTGRAARSVGESAALLVDDKRRLLHAVWTQPLDEAGTIKARIFHAAARLSKR